MPSATAYPMLINGRLVTTDASYPVLNPSTEEVIAEAPHASRELVDEAVAAAEAVQGSWADLGIDARKAHLKKVLDIWPAHEAELIKLLVREQGKPKAQAEFEVGFCVTLLKSALDITLTPQVMDQPNARVEVHRRPVGVVVGITPWNFPLFIGVQKWAPALILGNTFLWKPSPYTPLTALYCSAFLKDCFPPGVLSILSGDDKSDFNVGGYLTSHPKVNKITFTGSVRTGMRIMASAASDMKRLTLELGGNDAAIVRADCDPKETAKAIFGRAFANSGQVCVAIKRAFVQRSIYKKFCEELAAFAQTVKLGDGFEEGVMYGPLNNQMQLDHVKALVEDARGRGAKILSGGKQPGGKGYFYEPTIVADIAEGARLVDEEQFGPALPVIPYDTDDEAVQRANATQYGLGGSVWSKDVEAASKLAHRLRAGTVWVNEHFTITGGPFGGFKHSGIGRELGDQDVVAFTELQTLSFTK